MLPHIIGFDKEKPQVSSRRNQLKKLRHLRQKTYDIVVQNTKPSEVSVIIIVMLIKAERQIEREKRKRERRLAKSINFLSSSKFS